MYLIHVNCVIQKVLKLIKKRHLSRNGENVKKIEISDDPNLQNDVALFLVEKIQFEIFKYFALENKNTFVLKNYKLTKLTHVQIR